MAKFKVGDEVYVLRNLPSQQQNSSPVKGVVTCVSSFGYEVKLLEHPWIYSYYVREKDMEFAPRQDVLHWDELQRGDDKSNNTEKMEKFASGAIRDQQTGKPRPDFINPRFILRVGQYLLEGADRYGEFNYDKGIDSQRYMAALMRHVLQYYAGDRSIDHLSAVVFNAQGLAMNEGSELDNLHQWNCGSDV